MRRSASLHCVDPKDVSRVWPIVRYDIKRAFDRQPTDDTFAVAEARLLAGKSLLWISWTGCTIVGAVITELWQTPSKKVCGVIAVGGRGLDNCRSGLKRIEEFAKDEGCDVVRFCGRKAWARVLPDYKQPWITLEKNI